MMRLYPIIESSSNNCMNMKKLAVFILLAITGYTVEAQDMRTDNNPGSELKPLTLGIRGMHVYDLPSYRFDGPYSEDMYGMNGDKTSFDLGFELYLEYMFNPFVGVQIDHRRANISGASDVEYYEGTFNLTGVDGIFIWNNLNPSLHNRRWNFLTKVGLGYGSYSSEQFLIKDDSRDQSSSADFWSGRIGLGVQYELSTSWRVDLEVMYNVAYDDGFDGYDEAKGSDTYLTTALGIAYTFGNTEKKPTYQVGYFSEDYLNINGSKDDSTAMANEKKIDSLRTSIAQQEDKITQKSQELDELSAKIDSLEAQSAAPKAVEVNHIAEVYFNFDSSVLTVEAKKSLAMIAQEKPDNIKLVAFADNIGDETYNAELRKRRAEAVKSFLSQFGYEDDQITIEMGETMPIDADNQFLNRKVTLHY
ncbi:MAG: hypothetical protein EP346_10995 [Bacteroidetes bacterium]|nr:MAG: hypothetical protein EP346_10995 [Bacteroidota bacterium]